MKNPAPLPDDFPNIPIPTPAGTATTCSYRQIKVDLAHPRAREPLKDVSSYGIAYCSYYARQDGNNAPYYRGFAGALKQILVREEVANRLVVANLSLKRFGLELWLLDGYRPISLQRELWNYFCQRAGEVLAQPSESDCIAFAARYCADPRDFDPELSETWPSHCTGGAVDITLRDLANGSECFMGSIFDDATPVSASDYFEKNKPQNASDWEARKNRRLLYWAMHQAGFANYPYEWWHFDYLNQMWAMNRVNAGIAPCYGPANVPVDTE
jgi:zinc D-Ala-D-Ala dipeptidase